MSSTPVLRRQLSSAPTHRQQTLAAISTTLHALNQKIVHSQHKADRFRQLLEDAPMDGSRLSWIQSQLNRP